MASQCCLHIFYEERADVPLNPTATKTYATRYAKKKPQQKLLSTLTMSTYKLFIVISTQYILEKFKGKPPSLIIHMHESHFRFDQQDGSFSYTSPMRVGHHEINTCISLLTMTVRVFWSTSHKKQYLQMPLKSLEMLEYPIMKARQDQHR